MAWFPGAQQMELQPESDAQPAIRPTQLIFHSIAAPWTPQRTYDYWHDSTNLESHFGVGYDGATAQYIGTQTRADANVSANRRADGTGAVSVETAANTDNSDPWTGPQIEALVRIGVWMHATHDVPLRVCRSADDPGYGYHRLFAEWSGGGTECPGDARVRQFHDVVFPRIVAVATGQTPPSTSSPEDDMPSVQEIATAVVREPVVLMYTPDNQTIPDRMASVSDYLGGLLNSGRRLESMLSAQSAALTALSGLVAQAHGLNADEVGAAVQAAVAQALAANAVHVEISGLPAQGS